ncbi:MAG: hypothetical protein WBN72_01610 [Nitrososphaeraceae archaeon]
MDLLNDSSGVRELRNSKPDPSEIPDSSLPASTIVYYTAIYYYGYRK